MWKHLRTSGYAPVRRILLITLFVHISLISTSMVCGQTAESLCRGLSLVDNDDLIPHSIFDYYIAIILETLGRNKRRKCTIPGLEEGDW